MLKIYGADLSAPAIRVRLVANYLGMEYEYIRIRIKEGDNRKPEFLELNPFGKIPVIDDNGFVLFESGVICRYLADKIGSSIYPVDPEKRAIVDQWSDFSAFHIGIPVGKVLFNRVFAKIIGKKIDEQSLKDGVMFLGKYLPTIDQQLFQRPFLAGEDFSLADVALLAMLDPADVCQIDLNAYKNITQWRVSLKQEPFYAMCHETYGESLKKFTEG